MRIFRAILMLVLFSYPFVAFSQVPKAPIIGLISRGDSKFERGDNLPPDNATGFALLSSRPGQMQGTVINLSWYQLEPSQGFFDWSVLDSALATITQYNSKFPKTPLRVRIRVWTGAQAPVWAKKIGGAPVQVLRLGNVVHIGRYWSATYIRAWDAFISAMATRYDSNPLIESFANPSCSVQTDEPFVATTDSFSVKNLKAAGYTDAQFIACVHDSIDLFASVFKQSFVEMPFNLYHGIDTGGPKADPAVTHAMIDYGRKVFGNHLFLGNHAVRVPLEPKNLDIISYEFGKGPPLSYQTASPGKIGNTDATVRSMALTYKADSLEMWSGAGGWKEFSAAQLATWAGLFAANHAR